MTPQVTITADDKPERRRGGLSFGTDSLKFVIGMVLAALVSYFSTTYGLQARMDVLEARVKASEANLQTLQTLTTQVAALSQQVAVLSALVERLERQTPPPPIGTRAARQFDH